ncbi:MAG: OmpA family protein [Labilithrix sp.]|nr:OmpA family protein [Labilithrix sp.]MCW5815565.1 OmpA family protein [Labilithrix sp.]
MQRPVTALSFFLFMLGGGGAALAAEPVRVHVGAGAAHAVGGAQVSEFSAGGAGDATVEVPATSRFGVQAGVGAVVLGQGDAASDPNLARTGTGVAFVGTAGVRLRAFGEGRPGGPWIDSNMGLAHTGGLTRPAVGAHVGWDFRVSSGSRIDVGPYVGYTQIIQPDSALRGDDARILSAGLAISLGAKERPKAVAPPPVEAPPPPPPLPSRQDRDPVELAEAYDACPDGEPVSAEGCVGEIRIFEDRILLEDVIHFEFASAKIRANSFRVVKKLAKFILDHDEIVDVSIEGHTDEIGTDEYNRVLSVERATAMRELLIWFGAPAKQLRVIGHGKSRLKIVTLKAEESNRRVELFVTVTRTAVTGGAAASNGKSSR